MGKSRTVGLVVLIASLILGAGAVALGLVVDGIGYPQLQCSNASERPTAGGPYDEGTTITGQYSFVPLGIICEYDSHSDDIGPQTVVHADWPATIVAAVAIAGAVAGIVLLVRRQGPGTARRL